MLKLGIESIYSGSDRLGLYYWGGVGKVENVGSRLIIGETLILDTWKLGLYKSGLESGYKGKSMSEKSQKNPGSSLTIRVRSRTGDNLLLMGGLVDRDVENFKKVIHKESFFKGERYNIYIKKNKEEEKDMYIVINTTTYSILGRVSIDSLILLVIGSELGGSRRISLGRKVFKGKSCRKEKEVDNLLSEGLEFAKWFRSLLPEGVRLGRNWRQEWGKLYVQLRRRDGRSKGEIVKVCRWARKDEFWGKNFLTPLKLRRKDKEGIMYYDVFLTRMAGEGSVAKAGMAAGEARREVGTNEYNTIKNYLERRGNGAGTSDK